MVIQLFKTCVSKEKSNFPFSLITFSSFYGSVGLFLMNHLRSCHENTVRLKSGLWPGHSHTIWTIQMWTCWYVSGHCPAHRQAKCAWGHTPISRHSPRIDLVVIRIINYSRLSRFWSSPRPPDHHTTMFDSVWCSFNEMWALCQI